MKNQNIIFFDASCKLCERFINFIFQRDLKHVFLYAPLQGETAKKQLNLSETASLKSIIFLKEGCILKEGQAIKALFQIVYPFWAFLFRLFPLFLFNWIYLWIAKNRYSWFGKKPKLYEASYKQKQYFLP